MTSDKTFDNLKLHAKILKAVASAGYTEPTEVQLKVIPKVMEGFDIRASAQTGTGKTAAFLLPALNLVTTPSEKQGKGARILVVVPTRELGMQIAEQAEKYSKYLDRVTTVCIGGGVPYHRQLPKLSRYHDILIATPGRLIDFMEQGKIDFSRLEMLILDEADRMLDMGFLDPVQQIVDATPESRQTLLFSATLDKAVINLSKRLMKDPIDIEIHTKKAKHENIDQKIHYVDDLHHKNRLLEHILSTDELESAIVFTSTRRHAEQLVNELYDKGLDAAALHGDMSQRQRTRTITELKLGRVKILVATDVAARGIDVQSITHVINFDLPRNIEDYVHRIGRTGRAGAKGIALSLVSGRDAPLVSKIEAFTGQKISIEEIAGFEPRGQRDSSRGKKKFAPTQGNRSAFKGKPHSRRESSNESSRDSRPPRDGNRDFQGNSNSPNSLRSPRPPREGASNGEWRPNAPRAPRPPRDGAGSGEWRPNSPRGAKPRGANQEAGRGRSSQSNDWSPPSPRGGNGGFNPKSPKGPGRGRRPRKAAR